MRNRIRSLLAPQPTENGSVCLAMLADFYGVRVNLLEAAQLCGVTSDGCTMEQIAQGAEALGFEAEMREADPGSLKKEKRPCIVSFDGTYAVLSGFAGNRAVLYTPERGRVTPSLSELAGSWGDKALFLTLRNADAEKKKPRKPLWFAFSLILKQNLGQTILYALILVGMSFLLLEVSHLAGTVTDRVYSGSYHLWGGLAQADTSSLDTPDMRGILGLIGLAATIAALLLLEIWIVPVFGRFSARIATQCRKSFLWPALNLPIDLYQIRSEGYFMSSAGQTVGLGYFLSKQMVEVIVRPVLAVCFLCIMAATSPLCALIVLVSVAFLLLASLMSASKSNSTGQAAFSKQSRESGFLLEGLKAIRSIRNSGSEFMFFRKYVDLNRQSAIALGKNKRIRRTFEDLPAAISNITKLALILTGAMNVFAGKLTFGDLIVVHGIYCIVADYIRAAVHSGQSILSIKYQLENLEDIDSAAETGETAEGEHREREPLQKLRGNIRLEHVTFGYSRRAGPVLKDISMDIPSRGRVAIVGASGCGKTTLKKLICGRVEPWKGEILYDGRPAGEVPKEVLANSIAAVDQQIILFEDSVMNNIKMWDSTEIDADAVLAAWDAEIHDDIILRENGYNARISEDGGNFSGGERQRIEIARALAMNPSILVLDEATSALDTILEKRIAEHMRKRGVTTIIVAHRLSTIRSCDCIYVMDQGRIAARGTHDELMQTCELYRTLVTVE